jgi:hypothetical protein
MRKLRRSISAASLTAVLAGGLTMLSATPAQAAWQCTVPPGMTYTWVTYDPGCGVPNGMSYDVVAPAEGQWACMAPVGWNWTETRSSAHCSANTGFPTTEYRLTKAS